MQITARSIHLRIGSRTILDKISLEIPSGSAFALIGPDLSQLRLGWCLWIVLVLVRAFWVCRVGH